MYLTQNPNTKLVENLSEKIKFYQTSILNRIIKAPRRLLYSIGISYFARYFPLIVLAKAQTFFGESIKVILPEKVSTTLYRYGYFEEGLARFCLQAIEPGMTCLDIGTHFGFFTLLFAHLTSKNGQVHCFEPTKSTFKILQENTKNKQNVILNNQAVWSENKTILFNDYGITDSAYNSIYAARWIDGSSKSSYKVETISIDTYIEKTGIIPHFIKIDAESAEHEILKGMQKTIAQFQPIITLEIGDMGIEGTISSKELIEYMVKQEYQALEYRNGNIENHIIREKYDYSNIFFMPRNKVTINNEQ